LIIKYTKKRPQAQNKNRKSRILFYATMVLLTGLWRLGSLPEQIYTTLDILTPESVVIISNIFLHTEPILVFLAVCINNSIPKRLYRLIRPKPILTPCPLYERTNSTPSTPFGSVENPDAYSLGSYELPKNTPISLP
jgi:hypothetical protein